MDSQGLRKAYMDLTTSHCKNKTPNSTVGKSILVRVQMIYPAPETAMCKIQLAFGSFPRENTSWIFCELKNNLNNMEDLCPKDMW